MRSSLLRGNGLLGGCQVAKKARKETQPATGLYSNMAQVGHATHEVARSREYKDTSNPDLEVPPEERAKSYKVHPSHWSPTGLHRWLSADPASWL